MVEESSVSKDQKVMYFNRFSLIGRPFTAESVVSKRGTLKVEYASNTQAKKLFALLEKHAKVLWLWNSSFDELGRYTNAHLRSTGSYSWY